MRSAPASIGTRDGFATRVEGGSTPASSGIRRLAVAVTVLLPVWCGPSARSAWADYVPPLTNRIFVDPADIAVIADG
jgi:hypothetical protein